MGTSRKIISESIIEHAKATATGVYGLSLERTIADALKKAGLLKDENIR